MNRGEYVLALEVTTGKNIPVPSNSTRNGFYVLASTSYGPSKTAIKAAESDHSVSWNETIVISRRPSRFPRWFLPYFFSTSKDVYLKIYASSECRPMPDEDTLVATVKTTFKELLAHDGEFVFPQGANERAPSITLKARHGQLSDRSRPRDRNVVVFGDAGSGKSSVINVLRHWQEPLLETSNNTYGCTSIPRPYEVAISDKDFILFDSAGLNEEPGGTVPAAEAKKRLKSLLAELTSPGSDGVGLLVCCVSSTRPRDTLVRNYKFAKSCGENVPIVVVVTGLEKEPDMKDWWNSHEKEFTSGGMCFKDHACVTTLREDSVFIDRILESRTILGDLIDKNCSQ